MRQQTIPDDVLDRIVSHRPHLASIVDNTRAGRVPWQQAETALAQAYLMGETRLGGDETYRLSRCVNGGPYGGD